MLTRLVLFDVDGTLLWPDGAGRASMQAALERVYGTAGAIGTFRFNGRTDRYIVHTLMADAGLPEATIQGRFDDLRRVMIEELSTRLAAGMHNVQPCPGTHELIAALRARGDALIGLVTGNFQETAILKVQAAGFDPAIFTVGAYGNESADRNGLPPLVVERAHALAGVRFAGQQIVVIGDTSHDVRCGRGVGARTIAVLTGWDEQSEIEAAGPDYVFEKLSDTARVLAAIYSEAMI